MDRFVVRASLSLLALTALIINLSACGNGRKTGWTNEIVAQQTDKCISQMSGSMSSGATSGFASNPQVFTSICSCYIDKASRSVPFPPTSADQSTTDKIFMDCLAKSGIDPSAFQSGSSAWGYGN
jgi:hypothetical protein